MAQFTPTTDIVRSRYIEFPYVSQIKDEPGDPAEFDRWLAKHDAATYSRGYSDSGRDQRQAGNGMGPV